MRLRLYGLLLSSVIAAAPAGAEIKLGSQANADLSRIRERAATLPEGEVILRGLERRAADAGGITPEYLREYLGFPPPGAADQPIRYRDRPLVDAAANRAQVLATVFAADLDNDGSVTREEVARVLQAGRSHGSLGDTFLKLDTDLDDRLSPEEIASGAAVAGEAIVSSRQDRIALVGELIDFNGDGQIAPAELTRAAAALTLLAAPIPGADPAVTEDTGASGEDAKPQTGCALPEASAKAEIHILTGYEGSALSNLSIGGQDRVTQTAQIEIEPGDTPLYLVLASYELVIWQVTGAVDRVERIVVQSAAGDPGIRSGAVVGLPAEKVIFVAAGVCLAGGWEDGAEGLARDALRKHLGRDATRVHADYTFASVALPSGEGGSAKRGEVDIIVSGDKRFALTEDGMVELPRTAPGEEDAAMARELERFHPGGLVTLDPATVVSAYPVEPYVVLPQQAGLAQLMEQGLIKRQGDAFLVLQPIPRFPAGLWGANSVSFVLGPGVPMPPGEPGHSSVRDANRKCLVGSCR
jgi:hypothetical protein